MNNFNIHIPSDALARQSFLDEMHCRSKGLAGSASVSGNSASGNSASSDLASGDAPFPSTFVRSAETDVTGRNAEARYASSYLDVFVATRQLQRQVALAIQR